MNNYMMRALKLAGKYQGKTAPNPMVGAVVVKNGQIIGEGAHQLAGCQHAEAIALQQAGNKAKGADLYVNLEPCCHQGNTPPCTDMIVKSGIKKVIAAMKDPDPRVNGKGFEILRSRGIDLKIGEEAESALKLNEVYCKNKISGLPFLTMKAAISLDGKISCEPGKSCRISNSRSRLAVHHLRSIHDAILIGRGTLETDNPRLSVRYHSNNSKLDKIILFSNLDIDASLLKSYHINDNPGSGLIILIANNNRENLIKKNEFEDSGFIVKLVEECNKKPDLMSVLTTLYEEKIYSILLEGGSRIFTSFLNASLIDKFHLIIAPLLIGNKGVPLISDEAAIPYQTLHKLINPKFTKIGDNIMITCYPNQDGDSYVYGID